MLLTLSQFGLRSNYREGTQPHPSAENWIKDLLSLATPIRERPRFPCSQCLSSGSFHKFLILIHQRVDRMETTFTEYLLGTIKIYLGKKEVKDGIVFAKTQE